MALPLVTPELVREANPSLTASAVMRIVDAVNSHLTRIAPCITGDDPGVVAEATQIVFRALQRNAAVKAWIAGESSGKFAVQYRAGSASILDAADETALRTLCSGDASSALGTGTSRGSFPEPSGIENLYSANPADWGRR